MTARAGSTAHPRLRWPLADLLDATGLSRRNLATHLRLRPRDLRHAVDLGLTDAQADEWAIALGLHPASVWGRAWLDAADDAVSELPDGDTVHERVAADVRRRLATGELRAGDKVPTAAEVAAQYGLSRRCAAQAVAALRTTGHVTGRPRTRPTFVCPAVKP